MVWTRGDASDVSGVQWEVVKYKSREFENWLHSHLRFELELLFFNLGIAAVNEPYSYSSLYYWYILYKRLAQMLVYLPMLVTNRFQTPPTQA